MKFLQFVKVIKQQKYFLLYSILLFFTPLIFVTNTNELFEFPKMFFVYFMALLIGYVFVLDLLDGRYVYRKPGLLYILFFLTFLISTIFSSHLYTSVWGYYSRFNDGLTSVIAFGVIYIVAYNVLTKDQYSKLMDIVILTIFPIGIYGIGQHFGLSGLAWGVDTVERVFSTFGQPNWLAQYLVMLLPFCLYDALFATLDPKRANVWGIMFVLGFSSLWFTYSLSGLMGFLIAMLIFVAFFKKQLFFIEQSKVYLRRAIVLCLICVLVVFTNPGVFLSKAQDALFDIFNNIGAISVVYAQDTEITTYKVSDPGFIRLSLWKGTWELISSSKKVFFIGTGPETYPYAFQPFRPQSLNYSSEWNYVFNKPHNYYLEILAESGLIGLLSYLALIIYLFLQLPKTLLPGFAGFLVTNIFGWPVVATALLFWFFLALGQRAKEHI